MAGKPCWISPGCECGPQGPGRRGELRDEAASRAEREARCRPRGSGLRPGILLVRKSRWHRFVGHYGGVNAADGAIWVRSRGKIPMLSVIFGHMGHRTDGPALLDPVVVVRITMGS